jgi:hypothetical protein
VVVGRFLSLVDAVTAAAALEAEGLSPELLDVHMVGLNWGYAPAIGGIRLRVPSSEETAAEELLDTSSLVGYPLTEEDAAFVAQEHARRRARGFWALLFIVAPGLAFIALPAMLLGRSPTRHEHAGD